MIPITFRSNFKVNSKQISIVFRLKEELKTKAQIDELAQENSCA